MSSRRRVLFITAIRSEYDILYPILDASRRHSVLEPLLVVAGAHLSPAYGRTIGEIEADGFPIVARIESLLSSDTKAGRVKSAAIQLSALVDVIANERPDIVVATADREDALTVAMAGAFMSVPVAHIGGGDHAADGNIDNAVRDAVTKLAHVHLVTTARSASRVLQLGEEAWRVFIVGASGLDRLLTVPTMSPEALSDALEFDVETRPVALVIQHPFIDEVECAADQIRRTLEALMDMGIRTLVSYPNSDAGSHQMIEVIEEYASRFAGRLRAYRSLPRDLFVNLLRTIDVLVGNSSSGIIEAPLLHLPVVNVGKRQREREHADNVLFVDHDTMAIQEAVRMTLKDPAFRCRVATCLNPYGDGHAGERIAEVLAGTPLNGQLIYKRRTEDLNEQGAGHLRASG